MALSALVAAAAVVGALVAVGGIGSTRATVPSVSGEGLASAEATLAADGFHWTVVHLHRGRPGARPGRVVSQQPSPNVRAARGSTVRLSVWLSLTNGPDVRVPDLVHMVEWQAQNAIADRGLTSTLRGPPRPGSSSQYWRIVSQSPAPGTSLPVGTGRVTITVQAPPAIQVTARIPMAACAFIRTSGVHVVAAYVITSAELRRPPIADGGPLSRQAPGSEWRLCYVTGPNVAPSYGGPPMLVGPGARRGVRPPSLPRGPQRAIYVYYRSGSIAEVVGMASFRFDAVEGSLPAQRFPWLSEASF